MPIYDFKCKSCKCTHEVSQSINALAPVCQKCLVVMDRVFISAPIIHGARAKGREQAARSLPVCGKGCRCCP